MNKNNLYGLFLLSFTHIVLADNISNVPNNSQIANINSSTENSPATATNIVSNSVADNMISKNTTKQDTHPDTSDDSFHRFFINGSFGGGVAAGTDNTSSATGPAYSLNAGLNFDKNFAIEAGYSGVIGVNPTILLSPFGYSGSPSIDYSLYDVAFRSTLHLSQYFSFYGKVGGAIETANWQNGTITYSNGSSTQTTSPGPNTTSFGALLGGGASVDLGPIGIFLEFDQYLAMTGQNSATPANLSLLNFGLQYNF